MPTTKLSLLEQLRLLLDKLIQEEESTDTTDITEVKKVSEDVLRLKKMVQSVG